MVDSTHLYVGQVVSWYICTFAALAFLALRVTVRIQRFRQLFIDDYLIILSSICLVGDLAIQQRMWNLGMSNIGGVDTATRIKIMKMIIPGSTLYITSLWTIKIGLVIFYKRLAARTTLQLIYNILLGILGITYLFLIFYVIFACTPIERNWNNDPACPVWISNSTYWITILSNILTDFIIVCLPISMVLKLKLPPNQKAGVAGIFALGFFVIISSIVRAYYSKRNETMLTCTVSMVETSIAIIASSLPSIKTLIYHSRSTNASSGRHYELSSHRIGTQSKVQAASGSRASRLGVGTMNKSSPISNDSDEDLFAKTETSSHLGSFNEQSASVIDPKTGIMVSSSYTVASETDLPPPVEARHAKF